MLNQTVAMALTVRRLADEGFRPCGDLVFWAVPDEENGGYQGAKQLIETNHDLVRTDFALTEVGGAAHRTPNGLVVDAAVSDKGSGGMALIFRGTPSHASLPPRRGQPPLKAAEAVRRIDAWRPAVRVPPNRGVAGSQRKGSTWDLTAALIRTASTRHSRSSRTRCCSGPRMHPLHRSSDHRARRREDQHHPRDRRARRQPPAGARRLRRRDAQELRDLLADLIDENDILSMQENATESPIDTPLWDVLSSVTDTVHQGATLVPAMLAAWTDASWMRPAGTTTYGFGLLSEQLSPGEYWARFHGVDERIDLESLELSAVGWYQVARQFLG